MELNLKNEQTKHFSLQRNSLSSAENRVTNVQQKPANPGQTVYQLIGGISDQSPSGVMSVSVVGWFCGPLVTRFSGLLSDLLTTFT